MNFGIVGAGSIARTHAEAIRGMEGCSLRSLCSSRGGAANAAGDFDGVAIHRDLDSFLSDPELDIVTIATPSGAHFEPAVAALRADKHVLCEKPLEITCERIDAMIAVARESGKTLAAILNRRFHPAMDAFHQAVGQGRLGRLTSASCYVKWFRDQAYYDSAAWRGTWALDGGGALMNQGIHAVDALLHLAGPVKSVTASTACLAHERIEVEDCVVATLEFENGARGVIEASTCAWSSQGHPARIQLCGTRGSVFLADEAFEVWDFADERPEDQTIRRTLMHGAAAGLGANDPKAIGCLQHRRNFEEVVRAIRDGREPTVSAAGSRKAVRLIEAVYQSARGGGVRVDL